MAVVVVSCGAGGCGMKKKAIAAVKKKKMIMMDRWQHRSCVR